MRIVVMRQAHTKQRMFVFREFAACDVCILHGSNLHGQACKERFQSKRVYMYAILLGVSMHVDPNAGWKAVGALELQPRSEAHI